MTQIKISYTEYRIIYKSKLNIILNCNIMKLNGRCGRTYMNRSIKMIQI